MIKRNSWFLRGGRRLELLHSVYFGVTSDPKLLDRLIFRQFSFESLEQQIGRSIGKESSGSKHCHQIGFYLASHDWEHRERARVDLASIFVFKLLERAGSWSQSVANGC